MEKSGSKLSPGQGQKPKLIQITVQPLRCVTNSGEDWKKWYQTFKIYLRASGLSTEDDGRKVAVFLHMIGERGMQIFNSLNLDAHKITYQQLVTRFEQHFQCKTNITYESYLFFNCKQVENESLEEFVANLRNKSQCCEFKDLQDRLIKDMFICNMHEKYQYIRDKLLVESDLTLDKAISLSKTLLTLNQANVLKGEENTIMFTRGRSKARSKSNQNQLKPSSLQISKRLRTKCGQVHTFKCPAAGETCHTCCKRNNFGSVSLNKSVRSVQNEDCEDAVLIKMEPMTNNSEPIVGHSGTSRNVHIKQEPDDVSEEEQSVAEPELYANHEIKEEMVIGPEVQQSAAAEVSSDQSPCLGKQVNSDGENDNDDCSPTHPKVVQREGSFQHNSKSRKHLRIHKKEKSSHRSKELILQKRFVCDVCGKCFNRKNTLMQHLLIHTGEKRHVCDVCRKCFTRKNVLNRHMKIHTGEKSHVCDVCSKCFTQKGHLSSHMKLHTGEKSHVCNVCNKCFTQEGHLREHMKIHTGEKSHVCDVCSKCFTQKSNLRRHMEIHSGEKRHMCDVCSKCFTLKDKLSSHMKIHTGEKSHMCDVCMKCFTRKSNLRSHMKMHNK